MFNILNGGKHALDSTDFQEFMVMPIGAPTYREALRAGAEVFHALRDELHERGFATGQGDEGGFAPSLDSNQAAIEMVLRAIERAGYKPGEDVAIALDPAVSELVDLDTPADSNGELTYRLAKEGRTLRTGELIDFWVDWADRYPIVSLEDGLAEDDWAGWAELNAAPWLARPARRRRPAGDERRSASRRGMEEDARPTRCSSSSTRSARCTETLATIDLALANGWGAVISHRSGETEDTTIADLAVATGAGQLKSGAPSRSERVAKFNRLLRIEAELGDVRPLSGRRRLLAVSR